MSSFWTSRTLVERNTLSLARAGRAGQQPSSGGGSSAPASGSPPADRALQTLPLPQPPPRRRCAGCHPLGAGRVAAGFQARYTIPGYS